MSPIRALDQFDGARRHRSPQMRLEEVRERSRALHDTLMERPSVPYYRSASLVRVPYPTRFAFLHAFQFGALNALRTPSPFVHIINRLFVVQFPAAGRTYTLLFSPSDVEGAEKTPYFRRLRRSMGPLEGPLTRFLAPKLGTVEGHLAAIGLSPEQVDFISFDHLHTQDVRRWLGSGSEPGWFPNAKLLVMRQEWESARGLLPPQAEWYCPQGTAGVPDERVVLLDGDIALGESVMLMRTPGHTEGNHSLVVRTEEGVLVTSENGVGPDSYAPLCSDIPGLRAFAVETGSEVVLNGNTLEGGLDQYISMVQEKEVAGPSTRRPEFPNVVSSSELAEYWGFPGLRPTFSFEEIEHGRLVQESPLRASVEAR